MHAFGKIAPRPVFLVQGDADKKILPRETVALFNNAREPKELRVVKRAGHSFAYFEDLLIKVTLERLIAWNPKEGKSWR